MMKLNKILLFISMGFLAFSCTDSEKLGDSIFDTQSATLDPESYTYDFDKFLMDEFMLPYNLSFEYQLSDVSVDMNYNLVPANLDDAKKLAVLIKYLWFDVYAKVAGPDFLKAYGPKMIHLIGSPAYNPASGTMLLGEAEGGIKISLFKVNDLDVSNVNLLNEFYFKTMHHEFAHILHQTKNYPVDFNLISYKDYDPYSWQDRPDEIAWSLGFASPYGSSQTREDFVEVIANYIVKTDAQWSEILQQAAKEWTVDESQGYGVVVETSDSDGIHGEEVILNKLQICRLWMQEQWNVNLDSLRAEVQFRQANIDIDSLLKQINR